MAARRSASATSWQQNPEDLKTQVGKIILSPHRKVGLCREIPAATSVDFDTSLLWWIVGGEASLEWEGRQLLWMSEGDLIGPWSCVRTPLTVSTPEKSSCKLLGFPQEKVWSWLENNAQASQLWAAYQTEQCARLFSEFVELKALSAAPAPHFRRFKKGETIILEGAEGDDVYVLARGLARVMRRGSPVGEIHQDEIFGALAALTDSARTATVIASEPCDCMVFRKEEFRDLLRANPELMDQLFHDFGRALHDMNDSVQKAHLTKWKNLF
jgi:CRP-like cAMP-binding protein